MGEEDEKRGEANRKKKREVRLTNTGKGAPVREKKCEFTQERYLGCGCVVEIKRHP